MKSSGRRTLAYFDTSVIVKNYIRERGSDRARRLLRSHRVATSAIAALETVSAFRRNLAANVIDDTSYSAILNRFQKDRAKLDILELTDTILETSEQYISTYNVRSLDAIHLATAMAASVRFPKQIPFITSDSGQSEVARQLGLKVVWVE